MDIFRYTRAEMRLYSLLYSVSLGISISIPEGSLTMTAPFLFLAWDTLLVYVAI